MEDNKENTKEVIIDEPVKNTIEVDSKLLVNVLNLIHKDHSEIIDTYNGLLTTILNSGKLKQ